MADAFFEIMMILCYKITEMCDYILLWLLNDMTDKVWTPAIVFVACEFIL